MSAPISQSPEFFSQEQMQQILHLAIARQTDDELISRQHLQEIAAELGIERECLAAAELEWLANQQVEKKRQDFNFYRQHKFKQKFFKYLLANSFFVSINLLTGGTLSWSLYILLIWGVALANTAWKTYQNQGEEYEKDFQTWERKDRFKRTIETVWDKFQKAIQAS
jgi:hypothetical protein